ncbi:hypothetical protein [Paenibacillus lautus]|uniref:hypothetical protein n=1 Tax=Paenibacillus lautus TaxID=1401 RepID=UPI003986DE59
MAEKTKLYHVTNDFVDKNTDEIIKKGSIYEADEDRVVLLKAADVIGKEATKAEIDEAKKEASKDTDGGKDAGKSEKG